MPRTASPAPDPPAPEPVAPAGARRPRRFLVLPADLEIGWSPFLWLIYLLNPFLYLAFAGGTPLDWVAAVAVAALFLPLYFWGYWSTGRRLLGIIATIALLGALYIPFNPAASVYFVYAAGFVGYAGAGRGRGLALLGALLAALGLEAWLVDLHPWAWGPGVAFVVIVGLTGIHYGEVHRKNLELRRAREEVERLAQVAERERIARDLHDLLGHTLTLISVKADLAVRLAEREPERSLREMREVHQTARRALAEVRRAVRGYRAQGTGGLGRELDRVCAGLASGGIGVTVEGDAGELAGRVTPEREEALAFALREAATNVLRHSRARGCRILLERRDGRARVVVADDGRGGGADGTGLAGLRERLEGLGGSLRREVDGGTRVVAEVPLAAGADAGAPAAKLEDPAAGPEDPGAAQPEPSSSASIRREWPKPGSRSNASR